MKSSLALATLLCAALALPAVADETPQLSQAMTTSGHHLSAGKRVPVQTFSQQDFVVQLADFKWATVGESGGKHQVEWRWYHEGELVSKTAKELLFNSTPYTIWTKRAASTLGAGHFRVDALIDGAVVAANDFDITPDAGK